jgi:hypothetical protein
MRVRLIKIALHIGVGGHGAYILRLNLSSEQHYQVYKIVSTDYIILHYTDFLFLYITMCNQLKINQSFNGNCRLHLQGRRISQARIRHEAGGKRSLKER